MFFTSGGSDSIDTAAKMARRYWALAGEPARHIIVCGKGAYHGVNGFGTSLSGIEANAAGWGPLVTPVVPVPRHDLAALERVLQDHAGRVAAFIGEPVQGAAGVHPPRREYWPGVQDLLRSHDVLLIADEVITGFGRVGRWFGSDRYWIERDLITGAKGLSSGHSPIGAVIVGERVLDRLWADEAGAFRRGYTYSGHPAACAVALASLEVIEREGLVERVADLEPVLVEELGALASHPLVEAVRTAGLVCRVELSREARAADRLLVERVVVGARARRARAQPACRDPADLPSVPDQRDELRLVADTVREVLDEVGT